MALHTAGDLLNWHPHIHALMLYGATSGAGEFCQLGPVDSEYLTARFASRVLDALMGEGLIDQETVDNMLSWDHSGFHVFVGEPIEPENQESRRFVAQYLKKSPVSLARLELIETGTDPVLRCRSYNNNLAEHKDFSPLRFLAELSQHIPDEWEQTVRYMGTLSARSRGAARLHEPVTPKIAESFPAAEVFCLSRDSVSRRYGRVMCLPWNVGISELGLAP